MASILELLGEPPSDYFWIVFLPRQVTKMIFVMIVSDLIGNYLQKFKKCLEIDVTWYIQIKEISQL